ncbi:hypothetical protein K7432_011206 [Basidiobolus ranarum]|uniref:Enoyl reductase (ER) domain-containing protein n=1 Tax=Basidiobolus ranarum TaxID=34480 RepID=A0ABR2VUA3_9FUNG
MSSQQFHCYACYNQGENPKPWTYEPRPLGDDDVEIEISHCGICGTDIHNIDNDWGMSKFPLVPGHEIIGKVTAKGSKVSELQIGDRVGVGYQASACFQPDCKACSSGIDSNCPRLIATSGGRYSDGAQSHGGWAKHVRVLSNYAFKIPDSLDSAEAAPLLCAGVTVFAPMRRHGVKAGDRVGVIGIGGLGHLAIQFANALGAEVTAISTSMNKKEEAHKLGAKHFINIKDENDLKKTQSSLDFILVTASVEDAPYDTYASMLDVLGKMILLGIPSDKVKISPFALIAKNATLTGSAIGSIDDQKAMLDFCTKHNVRTMIEKFPMSKIDEAIQRVRDGKVRYRVVLEN